ncbi:kynurenine/alpha-aminoadipate aminotransferase, mitochondrial-like [Homarus americanus]|uniref:kynurenine/alpha-aminoadipate aminotransferase, mitochondrial-like n=1 Tax=Homarus americanus TaxID=6706 RepID=UPI001C47AEB4|nr:kynurenine/alpha-aminoadipate aminotransferase, mitochondrial-like [Homarus americanus]
MMDYTKYMNAVAKNRQPMLIAEFFKLQQKAEEDVVFLATGSPSPDTFPILSGSLQMKDGRSIALTPEKMACCLQYGPTPGYPPLLQQLADLTQRHHSPPRWHDTDLLVTSGSQSGLLMTMEMMITAGDYVLVEEPCYTGALSILNPFCPRYLAVQCDQAGPLPESLRAALKPWAPDNQHNRCPDPPPKFLYTVPTGSNPTGTVTTAKRRREIYNIAREYDILILEDDPYYFLQYDHQEVCMLG